VTNVDANVEMLMIRSRSHPEPFVQSVRITLYEPTASDPSAPLGHDTP
jgi:hypothetical protein